MTPCEEGRYQVRITVEESPAPVQTSARHGWVGVDTNSTFLALCHVLLNGNPHAFATIGDPRLFDVRSTQRDALVGGLAVETVQWATARGAGLVVEDLQFIHDRDVSAKVNRVTHQFTYRALLTAIERPAAREGVALALMIRHGDWHQPFDADDSALFPQPAPPT